MQPRPPSSVNFGQSELDRDEIQKGKDYEALKTFLNLGQDVEFIAHMRQDGELGSILGFNPPKGIVFKGEFMKLVTDPDCEVIEKFEQNGEPHFIGGSDVHYKIQKKSK